MALIAAADLSLYQYHFVKLSADNTVAICAADTDIPIGVLQNKPDAAGKSAQVMLFGVTKLMVGSAGIDPLIFGSAAGTDANGEAEDQAVTDTTRYNVGRVLEGAAAGELCTAIINCLNPMRNA